MESSLMLFFSRPFFIFEYPSLFYWYNHNGFLLLKIRIEYPLPFSYFQAISGFTFKGILL